MFYKIKLFLKDRAQLSFFASAVLLQLISLIYTFDAVSGQKGDIFLHYSMSFGVDQIGPKAAIFYPIYFALAAIVINCLLSILFHTHDRLTARTLAVFTFLLSLLISLGNILIVNLNL